MTTKAKMLVTVFGKKQQENCYGGGWGPKWSSEETAQFLARSLNSKYGGKVAVEYIDMDSAESQKEYAEVVEAVSQYKLEYPLVAIDGEVKMVGGINFGMIFDEIEGKGESESAAGEEGE